MQDLRDVLFCVPHLSLLQHRGFKKKQESRAEDEVLGQLSAQRFYANGWSQQQTEPGGEMASKNSR
jgi:hypothetical protein